MSALSSCCSSSALLPSGCPRYMHGFQAGAPALSSQLAQRSSAASSSQLAVKYEIHRRHGGACCAAEVIGPLAGMSPSTMQDVLVGGAVFVATGAALAAGLAKEPVVCDLCQGNGGTRCFACAGEGKMVDLISRDELLAGEGEAPKRNSGMQQRGGNPRGCKVCRGAGLIGCSKCKGSGYV